MKQREFLIDGKNVTCLYDDTGAHYIPVRVESIIVKRCSIMINNCIQFRIYPTEAEAEAERAADELRAIFWIK